MPAGGFTFDLGDQEMARSLRNHPEDAPLDDHPQDSRTRPTRRRRRTCFVAQAALSARLPLSAGSSSYNPAKGCPSLEERRAGRPERRSTCSSPISGSAASSTVGRSGPIGRRPCFGAVAGVVDVIAGDPIRRDLQAHRATARVAEQPPASTPVSLPERTTSGSTRARSSTSRADCPKSSLAAVTSRLRRTSGTLEEQQSSGPDFGPVGSSCDHGPPSARAIGADS